ncbi:MAG: DNA cytosine methyltransferase, partial [Chthoniobacterales bacterium]
IFFLFFQVAVFLDLGFEKSGYEIVLANELIPEFAEAHHFSRNRMRLPLPKEGYHQGSISEFFKGDAADKLSSWVTSYKNKKGSVGFIGGPPCPDFSIAGKNKGRRGERGRLTGDYFKLIATHRPDWFLFENVKGLWRTKKHRIFYDEMKNMMEGEGYIISDRLINSIEYGVPQDRERIIMIGFLKDRFLEKNKANLSQLKMPWTKYIKASREELFGFNWPQKKHFRSKQYRSR